MKPVGATLKYHIERAETDKRKKAEALRIAANAKRFKQKKECAK